jgi:hypothetical protein
MDPTLSKTCSKRGNDKKNGLIRNTKFIVPSKLNPKRSAVGGGEIGSRNNKN